MKRAILLFQIIDEFSRCHSCDLLEISPRGGSLTVTDVVEKFMNICLWVVFYPGYNIVDTSLGKILDEGHSCISLEGFSHVGAI